MPLRMKKAETILFTIVILILTGVHSLAAGPFPDQDHALSYMYSDLACSIKSEDPVTAFRLAGTALEFNPGNGDASAVLGEILLKNETVSLYDVRKTVEDAVFTGEWHTLEKSDGVILLARIYDQLMLYHELDKLFSKNIKDSVKSIEWFYYAARGALKSGRLDAGLQLMQEATSLYPGSDMLIIQRLEADIPYRELIIQDALAPGGQIKYSNRILSFLSFVSAGEIRRTFLEKCKREGFSCTEAELSVAENMQMEGGEGPDLTGFLDVSVLSRLDYFHRVRTLFKNSGRTNEFDSYLLKNKLNIYGDSNSDGFPDQQYRLESGRLSRYYTDPDQDRVNDYSIFFTIPDTASDASTIIQRMEIKKRTEERIITFHRYPYVSKVEILDEKRQRELKFTPGVLSASGISVTTEPMNVQIVQADLPPDSQLEASAYSLEIRLSDTSVQRINAGPVITRQNGEVRREIRENGSTRVERDLDGDGLTEIIELYSRSDGPVILLDYNEDGNFDYRYSMENGREEWNWTGSSDSPGLEF